MEEEKASDQDVMKETEEQNGIEEAASEAPAMAPPQALLGASKWTCLDGLQMPRC